MKKLSIMILSVLMFQGVQASMVEEWMKNQIKDAQHDGLRTGERLANGLTHRNGSCGDVAATICFRVAPEVAYHTCKGAVVGCGAEKVATCGMGSGAIGAAVGGAALSGVYGGNCCKSFDTTMSLNAQTGGGFQRG